MLKCVGTLTKCPYTAGGRSRQGLPKAGTTVSHFFSHIYVILTFCNSIHGNFALTR